MAPPKKIQHVYFNAKGRAERIRWVLAQAVVEYEDKRMVDGEWATLKPKTMTGGLPYIVADGVEIAQSGAVATYLAKQFGLLGSNDVEEALIRMCCDSALDTMTAKSKAIGAKDAKHQEECYKSYEEKAFPQLVQIINKRLAGGKQWLVGDKVSLADIHVAEFLSERTRPAILKQIEEDAATKGLLERVTNLPNIKKWIESRPQTKF